MKKNPIRCQPRDPEMSGPGSHTSVDSFGAPPSQTSTEETFSLGHIDNNPNSSLIQSEDKTELPKKGANKNRPKSL